MNLTKNELIRYYSKLYKIRETELRIVKEYPNQEIRCPVHLSIGQEAPAAAVNIFLKKNDFAISYHRSHAHYIAKDGDLKGASLRALRRISKKDATPQPARKSVTEKMTRVAAYETTKEDLGKWQPIVQENRKKETLTFEPSSKKMINRKDTLGALKDDFEPRTKMEKEIASILKDQADAFDEEQIAKAEELALSKMDPEEAKARRARLAKMKALMFYHERKAARLKKIKSKDYHRREKRANKMKAKSVVMSMSQEMRCPCWDTSRGIEYQLVSC